VTVDGLDTREHPPRDMASVVGFVFQNPEAQFVTERVEDELAFALENAGVPQLTMRKRVEEVLDALRYRVAAQPRGVVAFRRGATAGRHRSGVGAATQDFDPRRTHLAARSAIGGGCAGALVRLNADLGLTIVLAEHRLERVLQFADRVVFLPEAGAAPLVGEPARGNGSSLTHPTAGDARQALGWRPLPLTIKEGRRFAGR